MLLDRVLQFLTFFLFVCVCVCFLLLHHHLLLLFLLSVSTLGFNFVSVAFPGYFYAHFSGVCKQKE